MTKEELHRHYKKFECKQFSCPHKECDTFGRKVGKEELKEHLLTDCPEVVMDCSKCENVMKRREQYTHDCRESMLRQIVEERIKAKELDAKWEPYKAQTKEQAKSISTLKGKLEDIENQCNELRFKFTEAGFEIQKCRQAKLQEEKKKQLEEELVPYNLEKCKLSCHEANGEDLRNLLTPSHDETWCP